jgi:pimeloyl-[acyl-carrier protein] methyl ester esterase
MRHRSITPLIFVHGWALGPVFWSPILGKLSGYSIQCADLGFYGSPMKPLANTPLVIAHSLGVMWAIKNIPRPWAGLLSINGFTRFTRSANFPGVDHHRLTQMKSRLSVDAGQCVADFLNHCGMDLVVSQNYDAPMLTQGLEWLSEWDVRTEFSKLECPILAIAGSADPIISESHSHTCFGDVPLIMIEGGNHLLPHTHIDRLVNQVVSVANGDWLA